MTAPYVQSQRGFTLTELMVGVMVSLMVMAAAATMFSNSREVFRTASELSNTQQLARHILEELRNDIHKAGYMGCGGHLHDPLTGISTSNVHNATNPGGGFLPYKRYIAEGNGIVGANGDLDVRFLMSGGINGTRFLAGLMQSDEVDADSSYLLLQYAESPGLPVISGFSPPAGGWNPSSQLFNLYLANSAREIFSDNDIALISDCETAAVFPLTFNSSSSSSYAAAVGYNLGKNYMTFSTLPNGTTLPSLSEVGRFVSNFYYIGKQDGTSDGVGGECPANTLCRKSLGRGGNVEVEPLVSDVEEFHLSFNMDSNGDGVVDFYNVNSTDTGGNPNMRVVSVNIRLKLRYKSWLVSAASIPADAKVTDPGTQGIANYFTQAVVRIRAPQP